VALTGLLRRQQTGSLRALHKFKPSRSVSSGADCLVYALPSILRPIELAQLFAGPKPLEVELGCGDASFLLAYAKDNPERNFIGVERLLGRVNKIDRKGRRLGLTNLRGVRIESGYFLEYLLPRHCAEALHVYFPDPWPKLKHRRHRFINERFPTLAWQALQPGGRVYLRTDDRDYFEQMLAVFAGEKRFQPVETPAALLEVRTDFEVEFNTRGIATLHAAYERVD
jgi:tRNA (guanine-N7-)-methyltransferase